MAILVYTSSTKTFRVVYYGCLLITAEAVSLINGIKCATWIRVRLGYMKRVSCEKSVHERRFVTHELVRLYFGQLLTERTIENAPAI